MRVLALRVLALRVLALAAAGPAAAAETCHFAGTASYDGRITIETAAAEANGETTVDVTARVSAKYLGLIEWRYWLEELSVWRAGDVTTIAVNHRYQFAGRIIRQLWDVFTAGPDGLSARRVQGKTEAGFEARHPGFARHWGPASFGAPWLADYTAAAPERRADLDLPRTNMPAGTGPPLALAFYWIRRVNPDNSAVPVFLPGFKRDARADVRVVSTGGGPDDARHLRATLRHPLLNGDEASDGEAWITPDHHLERVTFDAHTARGNAHGDLRLEGCHGEISVP